MSGVNGRASGPVLQSVFLVVLAHSVLPPFLSLLLIGPLFRYSIFVSTYFPFGTCVESMDLETFEVLLTFLLLVLSYSIFVFH